MKRAAIGIRAHSGWGALVVVSDTPPLVHLLERKRIAIADAAIEGSSQPYHFAQEMKLPEAGKYLEDCAAVSQRMALPALRRVLERLQGYEVVGCAILLASGRPLPPLPQILASHASIHTAEGEFFRQAFWRALESAGIPVTGVRERDLDARTDAALRKEIGGLGRAVGPPWTADQKLAATAAMLLLSA